MNNNKHRQLMRSNSIKLQTFALSRAVHTKNKSLDNLKNMNKNKPSLRHLKQKTMFPFLKHEKTNSLDSTQIFQKIFKKNKRYIESSFYGTSSSIKKFTIPKEKQKSKLISQQVRKTEKLNNQELVFKNIIKTIKNQRINNITSACDKKDKKRKESQNKMYKLTRKDSQSIWRPRKSIIEKKQQISYSEQPFMLNFCDFNSNKHMRYCFLKTDNYSYKKAIYKRNKLLYINFEEHHEDILINKFDINASFIINKEVSDYNKLIQMSIKPKESIFKRKINKDKNNMLSKIKAKFSKLQKGCSIERKIEIIQLKKSDKKRKKSVKLYISKWMKLINTLINQKCLSTLNKIGYYDVKFGDKKRRVQYVIYDDSILISHYEYLLEKIEEDVQFNDSKILNPLVK